MRTHGEVTVGADPALAVVILKVRDPDKNAVVDCLLPPAQAVAVAGWLRSAAAHVRSRSRDPFAEKAIRTPKGEILVRVDGDGASVSMAVGEFRRGYRIRSPLSPEAAGDVAGWLEAAASDMKAQAEGKIDFQAVFPTRVGEA